MAQYLETLRGWVAAWECDTAEHFTTGYYFDRFAQSTLRMLAELGYASDDPSLPGTRECYVRYLRELNKGDVFHIESGVIDCNENQVVLGHRVIDSDTGELCTTMEQVLNAPAKADSTPYQVEWEGPEKEERADVPAGATWMPTVADVVRQAETDWSGRLDLSGYVHRFSTASAQCQARFGMSPSYTREQRFGFSTFEFQLGFYGAAPGPGERLEVETAIAHIGRSSIRLVHRMVCAPQGDLVATLSQMGVHLDLDARRPAPFPDELAQRARRLMA